MGSRMIRDRSRDSRWWLMVGLFTVCVVGWSLAFSFKVGAADSAGGASVDRGAAEQVWDLSSFTRLSISGSPEVRLVQGQVERVTATGDAEAIDRLVVSVQDDELVIRNKRDRWFDNWRDDRVALVVEFKSLAQLRLSGSAELSVERLASPEFDLVISGSGDSRFGNLLSDSLRLRVSGSADVNIAGEVANQDVRISGSADYVARELATEATDIRISGSGDAQIAVSSALDARISGSGSVRYLGQPEVRSSVQGSGDIRPL